FPLMFPAPKVNGYVVPGGWMPWRQLRLGCHPQDLYDELKALPGFNAKELAMDPALEAKAIEGCQQDEYEEWIELHIRREQHWFEILQHLMKKDHCDLVGVLFDGVDKIQHLCLRFLYPRFFRSNPDEWELRVRELCVDYFRQLDGILRKINDLSGPDANVAIASDHGFGPSAEVFHINTWLEQNGYLAWADPESMNPEDSETLGMGSIAKHVYELDWARTTAYVATPSSNGVYIVPGETGNGDEGAPREARRFRNRLMSRLRNFTDESTGQAIVSRIWSKDQVFDGPFKDLAPDLTLELRDGGLVSILPSESPLSLRADVTGAHRSQGVFMAKGPGVREGDAVSELSIMDVTPLLVYWMGLPIPEDFEGRLPEEIFESPVQADTEQPGVRPASPGPQSRREVSLSEEDEAIMVERLKALGYIE
ncbi:MAG: alkaline phosphatase family protein, partial [Chloroflexota bacterium]